MSNIMKMSFSPSYEDEYPNYKADGSIDLATGSIRINFSPDDDEYPNYQADGTVDLDAGYIDINLIPDDDDEYPDYNVDGTVDLDTGYIDINLIPDDDEYPDYNVDGTVDLDTGYIDINLIPDDDEYPDYSANGIIDLDANSSGANMNSQANNRKPAQCEICNGTGVRLVKKQFICRTCGDTGWIPAPVPHWPPVPCPNCSHGSGTDFYVEVPCTCQQSQT